MINTTDYEFDDISSEAYREYVFPNDQIVRITAPARLNVSASGGHRVFDAAGVSHYVAPGWLEVRWKAVEGAPNFVK